MLHLSFSADIEFLAAKMRNQLQSIWKKENAFESPQVIFPDRKIEQWFRLFWVKKFNVLANLNSIPLERFLWEALKPQEASQLSVDVLQHIINAALLEKDKNRSEEHTSELQSRPHLVCRLLLEKKKKNIKRNIHMTYDV